MKTKIALLINLCGIALGAFAQDKVTTDGGTIDAAKAAAYFKKPGYSPYAGRNFPTRVFWGDQHVHSSWSGDAAGGGTRLGPEEAIRFARGEEVVSATGQPVKLARPLDWLVVSDHSDALGVIMEVINGNPKLMADPTAKRWSQQMNAGGEEAMKTVMEIMTCKGRASCRPRSPIRSSPSMSGRS